AGRLPLSLLGAGHYFTGCRVLYRVRSSPRMGMAEPQQTHRIGWQPIEASFPKWSARSGWPRAGHGGVMVTGALFLMLVLLTSLLAAFIYQIVTTPLTAVDAPTAARAAAASAAAPELPVRRSRVPA